jgi:DNA-directed RNA polymerase subunit F
MPCAKQTEENVVIFLQRTKEFDISKVEKLQLLNYRPASLVDLFVILENCEDRFSAEQLDQILETVQELFPMDQA